MRTSWPAFAEALVVTASMLSLASAAPVAAAATAQLAAPGGSRPPRLLEARGYTQLLWDSLEAQVKHDEMFNPLKLSGFIETYPPKRT
jgi:hypothetical protein